MHRSSSKRTLNSFGKSTLWKYARNDTCNIQQQHPEMVTQVMWMMMNHKADVAHTKKK